MQPAHCAPRLTRDSKLVKNLLLKRDLLNKGDPRHKEIKTALIIDRGIMLGIYGGGVAVGLEKLGMTEVFDHVTGISGGIPDCAYFLSGQSELGVSIYYEELASRRFINFLRPLKIVDLDYPEFIFRKIKPLDTRKIRSSRSKFLIPVTDAKSGSGVMLDAKDESIDIVSAVIAAVAMPIFYNRPVEVDGASYFDGGTAFPLPLEYLIDEYSSTDILVVINYPCGYVGKAERPWHERLAAHIFLQKYPAFRKKFLDRGVGFNSSMKMLWEGEFTNRANVGILCVPDPRVGELSRSGRELRDLANRGTEQTLKIFNDY